jgi:hypothetical protein
LDLFISSQQKVIVATSCDAFAMIWHASGIDKYEDARASLKMREMPMLNSLRAGANSPSSGGFGLSAMGVRVVLCVFALLAVGCNGEDKKQSLEPVQLGMTSDLEPINGADAEDQIFEVKRSIQFPIAAPTQDEVNVLNGKKAEPYPRYPFLTTSDITIQVSWTLSNLDEDTHNVYLLIDPWNEFGRYVPGTVAGEEGEVEPNPSGIEKLFDLPGTKDARSSRLRGIFTVEDMKELAIDFATVMNILANPPPAEGEEDPTVGYVNHAFAWEQRSHRDLLSRPFIPGVIAGLTGIDIGLRTLEPANIALEVVVEVVDKSNGKVLEKGSGATPMPAPTNIVTVGDQGM